LNLLTFWIEHWAAAHPPVEYAHKDRQCPLILLQGARLEQVHHFKYLGVWLSATWLGKSTSSTSLIELAAT